MRPSINESEPVYRPTLSVRPLAPPASHYYVISQTLRCPDMKC